MAEVLGAGPVTPAQLEARGQAIRDEALRRLAQVVSPDAASLGFNSARLVSNWNEVEGRTFEEVDAAFGEAIERINTEIARLE